MDLGVVVDKGQVLSLLISERRIGIIDHCGRLGGVASMKRQNQGA